MDDFEDFDDKQNTYPTERSLSKLHKQVPLSVFTVLKFLNFTKKQQLTVGFLGDLRCTAAQPYSRSVADFAGTGFPSRGCRQERN